MRFAFPLVALTLLTACGRADPPVAEQPDEVANDRLDSIELRLDEARDLAPPDLESVEAAAAI
ncbi:hypothetical protein [Sphingomicrobium sediminis]|uniref:Uncharacterized protein n=1 Tax=Sphingomicrobium sediminis TaxID=2950949 RepID=A0A9X2ELF7_9SPHN|nr:hypothetical protein [Sphingomicrobium sediminis]MCM8557519.1 hypothetical protein [Sphingomicrobium sediminis]